MYVGEISFFQAGKRPRAGPFLLLSRSLPRETLFGTATAEPLTGRLRKYLPGPKILMPLSRLLTSYFPMRTYPVRADAVFFPDLARRHSLLTRGSSFLLSGFPLHFSYFPQKCISIFPQNLNPHQFRRRWSVSIDSKGLQPPPPPFKITME